MTLTVKIKNGNKYTLWNVISYTVSPNDMRVEHSDRQPTSIQGYIEQINRKD